MGPSSACLAYVVAGKASVDYVDRCCRLEAHTLAAADQGGLRGYVSAN